MKSGNQIRGRIIRIRNGCKNVEKKEEADFPDFIPESRLIRSKD
jgi:hypothetical protein